MDWKNLFFSFEGRIGRQAFWIAWLALLGVNVVLGWIPLIGWLLGLVSIYCSICIYATRLHDMGHTAWLQLIPFLVWIVAGVAMVMGAGGSAIVAALADGRDSAVAAAALGGLGIGLLAITVACLVQLGFLLWIGLTPGQPGPNRFGPPPPRELGAPRSDAPAT